MLHNDIPFALFRNNFPLGDTVVLAIFLVDLILINLYTIAKFINTIRALIATRCFTNQPVQGGKVNEEPVVTIQICAYNEASVIEDTINAACSVDWPKDKLFVQICDDSTDETTDIIMAAAASWREKGINCECLRRPSRIGYKAGSLHYHTDAIQGDFVALFDSDHRAEPSFLRRAIPHFYDEDGNQKHDIGLIQLPWAYYNTHQNLLTEYDALTLDISHVIDQTGRSGILRCFGFNGTGGIWRKEAIQAGGGWQWDTVTEDLDLSYLAHLAGYDFVYLRDLPQQLELPSGIRAHVQQKHRWTKGFFQVMRKSLRNVIKSPRSSVAIKFEAFFHFTGGIPYVCSLFMALLSPVAVHWGLLTRPLVVLGMLPFMLTLLCAAITVYAKIAGSNGHYSDFYSRTMRFIIIVPVYFLLSFGMCIFETYAVLDGLTSNDATFKRTPKEGLSALLAISSSDVTKTTPSLGREKKSSVVIYSDDHYICDDCCDKEEEHKSISKTVPITGIYNMEPFLTNENRRLARYGILPCNHFKDICLGFTGLFVAGYIVSWAILIFTRDVDVTKAPINLLILTPVPGLLFIHGSFCYTLFQPILLKLWNARKLNTKSL